MRGMAQRAIAFTASMTLLLTCPSLNMPASAEDTETDKVFDQTQPLTVVAKRITGDDTYFEISLEVNGDYDDYSSVGVVLRYDPEYITPADSWADGAPAADMTENTSWATRRALPTLGVDTWTTHTALAYEETEAQADADKPYGYLYLSAEHPRPEEGPDPDATVAPEPALEPMLGTESPSPDPDASPKPETGSAPVVAARFMYKTDGEKDGAAVKKELTDAWLKGANETNGLNDDKTENWDYDWRANKILTIAGDGIAEKSPAQYPFVIYTQNYEEKAFMFDFPSDTVSTTSGSLRAVDDYKYVVGSSIAEANRLKDTDIAIVTLEGESALKTGGLSLSDIMVIMFYDWDNSLIGTLTAGIGVDMTESVSQYVENKFVHPTLRNQGASELASFARKDSYRGIYPENGPDSSSPLAQTGAYGDDADEPGSKYPLTNKLDYVAAGKTLIEGSPYSACWQRITTDTMDDAWSVITILNRTQGKYGLMPKTDENGVPLGEDGSPDPSIQIPEIAAYNFSDIKATDLDGGVLMVKVLYTDGEKLNSGDAKYTRDNNVKYSALTSTTLETAVYGISFSYRRVNKYGYGVNRAREPKVRVNQSQITTNGQNSTVTTDVENNEVVDVMLTPSNKIETVDYQLVDTYDMNIVSGTDVSEASTEPFMVTQIISDFAFQQFQTAIFEYSINNKALSGYAYKDMNEFGFKFPGTGTTGNDFKSAVNFNNARNYMKKFITEGYNQGQTDPLSYTYYQLQYAIMTKGTGSNGKDGAVYLPPAEAEEFCKATYTWCQ